MIGSVAPSAFALSRVRRKSIFEHTKINAFVNLLFAYFSSLPKVFGRSKKNRRRNKRKSKENKKVKNFDVYRQFGASSKPFIREVEQIKQTHRLNCNGIWTHCRTQKNGCGDAVDDEFFVLLFLFFEHLMLLACFVTFFLCLVGLFCSSQKKNFLLSLLWFFFQIYW